MMLKIYDSGIEMTLDLLKTDKDKQSFRSFARDFKLDEVQQEAFLNYMHLLLEANKDFNITTITKITNVIDFHFRDSLELLNVVTMNNYNGIVDIGTGGGFPGIPLKILYPDIPVLLIEVNKKKIAFLDKVIDELGLFKIDLYTLDWRTFLRTTTYDGLDLFLARASLAPEELLRMFKPACPYNKATLVYWASATWEPTQKELPFLREEIPYTIRNRKRKLAFFSKKD